jgi:hypothetical protein
VEAKAEWGQTDILDLRFAICDFNLQPDAIENRKSKIENSVSVLSVFSVVDNPG